MSMIKDVIARAEVAMMGQVVPVNNFEEANLMASYIYREIYGGEKEFDFEKRVNQYNHSKTKNEIVGLTCSAFDDMVICNFILKNDSKGDYRIVPYGNKIDNYAYSLCWSENLVVDYFSELGDVFFKEENGRYSLAH